MVRIWSSLALVTTVFKLLAILLRELLGYFYVYLMHGILLLYVARRGVLVLIY